MLPGVGKQYPRLLASIELVDPKIAQPDDDVNWDLNRKNRLVAIPQSAPIAFRDNRVRLYRHCSIYHQGCQWKFFVGGAG